jgi:hypothetical protein
MLNTVAGRQQWLADVCVERVLPERVPRPRRGEENGQTKEILEAEGEGNVVEDGKVKIVIPISEIQRDFIQL